MTTRNMTIRADVQRFADEYSAAHHGNKPTIQQAAKALKVTPHSVDQAVRRVGALALYDVGHRSAGNRIKTPDVPQIGLAAKAKFWRQVVRATYPDRYQR